MHWTVRKRKGKMRDTWHDCTPRENGRERNTTESHARVMCICASAKNDMSRKKEHISRDRGRRFAGKSDRMETRTERMAHQRIQERQERKESVEWRHCGWVSTDRVPWLTMDTKGQGSYGLRSR